MKSKKHTIFLIISFAIFMVSVIVALVYFCEAKAELDRILSEVTDTQFRVGLELSLFWSIFFTIGILGTELSFIRSVYKMLKYKPNKWGRICYIISVSLAILSIVFYCLTILKTFNFVSANGRDYTGDIYLFVFWPSFIVSFILGSIPIGHNWYVVDQNSNNIGMPSDWFIKVLTKTKSFYRIGYEKTFPMRFFVFNQKF